MVVYGKRAHLRLQRRGRERGGGLVDSVDLFFDRWASLSDDEAASPMLWPMRRCQETFDALCRSPHLPVQSGWHCNHFLKNFEGF